MSSEHNIAIITVGYKNSPFVKEVLRNEIIPYSIVANNTSDFAIHHADPSKILYYSLEFTNLIEMIAQKSMDSLAVFETLGQFFEFYNPLNLSTLNYLISKYATSIKPEVQEYRKAWKEITTSIFDEIFIYPLFEESRIFHLKQGAVEVPVRQFLISETLERQKVNSKNNIKLKEQALEEITGIIDLDSIPKMKICQEAVKKITSASGVIIVPTDVLSLYILFQSSSFREALQKTDGKIAFISPFWTEHELNHIEKLILEKTGFEPSLINTVKLVKDYVDAVIIDDKDTELVATLRAEGITVLVEDLLPEKQGTTDFLGMILKTIDLSLDSIAIEPKGLIEGLGEKLVNLFRVREPKEEEIITQEDAKIIEIVADPNDQDILGSLIDEVQEFQEKEKTELSVIEDEPRKDDEQELLTDEFEMEVIDTQKDIPTIPTPPPKEIPAETDLLIQKSEGQFALPGIEQITQFDLEDLDSLDVDEHIITSFIERAMISNAAGLEVVFSDLLSLQNNPLLIDKIYQTIMKKLLKLREVNPEEKIADMITYLSAHKPDYYTERLTSLLEETINSETESDFYQNLRTSSLVVRSSLLIAGEIIENFITKYIATVDIYLEDKLRRMINAFSATNTDMMHLVSKVLLRIFTIEISKEDQDDEIINRIVAFLTMFDGFTVSMALITQDSDVVRESFLEEISELQINIPFKTIISNLIGIYNNSTYEELIQELHGRMLPDSVELEMMKRKYISSLSKVGSIPLELFADQVGLSIEKAEKMIYDMILKEEIQARIELVNGRLYIVQEGKEPIPEEIPVSEESKEVVAEKVKPKKEVPKKVKPKKEVPKKVKPKKEETEEVLDTEEFTCSECEKSFTSKRGLTMHFNRMHKK
ncbi:MAG: PCI domain-containing protein [Candidatus Heimdallarchaeaceae archaeon]